MTAGSGRSLLLEADGGSRGNPGVAGYGALLRDAVTGEVLLELAQPLGLASNNVAEYSGLVAGLQAVLDVAPAAAVEVRMDSKLVVEQMSGRWKIKHEDMRRLALQARDLCARIGAAGGSVSFRWIPRAENADADALSNEGMDGHTVRRVHEGQLGGSGQSPVGEGEEGGGPVVRQPLRLLLVQHAEDATTERFALSAARQLAGPRARVAADDDWAGRSGRAGPDERVRAAYRRVVDEGGDVVALTSRRGVLTVVTDILGVPADRFSVLATAPGSITGVQVEVDGTPRVAFTNRTDHLR